LTPLSSLKITDRSFRYTARYLWNKLFLLLFLFLISSIIYHYPALIGCHTLILDRLLTFLLALLSILVLKLSFSGSLSLHRRLSHPFFGLISWNYDHSLFGSYW